MIFPNPNCPYIPDHSYRILIVGGSGSEKSNALLSLIRHETLNIDRFYLYVKDPFESKYQILINGREKVGIKKLKNPKSFIDYSQRIDDVYENLKYYNQTKKRRVLIVFDNMIVDIESNKKSSPTNFFLTGRKLNISFVFILQCYFKVPKTIGLNATHYFIMKIPNKRKLQEIALNYSCDIYFKDFMKLNKDYIVFIFTEQYCFAIR